MTEPEEYIVHDYSAVNKQIEELADRELQISKKLELENKKIGTKVGIKNAYRYLVLLIALGIFSVLFAYAIRLVVYSPLI